MPPLMDDDTTAAPIKTSHYGFSNINVNDLGADSYTLFGLILDKSGSVTGFRQIIEDAATNVIKGCQNAPRADNMLVRCLTFDSNVDQVHDFKLLVDCAPDSYKGIIRPGGCTSLYDASVNIVESLANAGKDLIAKDYKANGIVVIVTDGEDVGSTHPVGDVKAAVDKARQQECLESIIIILIGVNITDPRISQCLKDFVQAANIDQYIEVDKADPKTFAKIAGFVVASVSSQSQSLGTGSASKPITF